MDATYFGYYDISPFQGEKVIYVEREKNSNVCNVVLNNVRNSAKQYLAESHAWNWQQEFAYVGFLILKI